MPSTTFTRGPQDSTALLLTIEEHLKTVCIVLSLCAAMAIPSAAKKFTVLANFTGPNGAYPLSTPVQGPDGNLYGTTFQGGASAGTIFKISVGGTLTTLYNFAGPDGIGPTAGLILATDGNFYGTTVLVNGESGDGTVFELSPNGSGGWNETTIYTFPGGLSGFSPYGNVILDSAGNLYVANQGNQNGDSVLIDGRRKRTSVVRREKTDAALVRHILPVARPELDQRFRIFRPELEG